MVSINGYYGNKKDNKIDGVYNKKIERNNYNTETKYIGHLFFLSSSEKICARRVFDTVKFLRYFVYPF